MEGTDFTVKDAFTNVNIYQQITVQMPDKTKTI